jgi:hydrogenase nickel incorporation protein HypA/HybF
MHEMGIALQILNIVRQSLPPDEPVRVKAIHLRVGKLTAIVPGSLKFCMEVVTKDTPAEGAALEFTEVPVVVVCGECLEESEISEPPFACKKCGSGKVEIVSGREMVVESIEVEDVREGEKKEPQMNTD